MAFWTYLAGALLGGGANMASTAMANKANLEATKETNKHQMDMFNKQMDYTKSVQGETWRRDDTELRRRVYDANKAGLSPLAAINGSSSSQVVSQPSAPHLQAPHYDSIMSGVNLDSAIDSIIAAKKLDIDKQNADTNRMRTLNDDENTKLSIQTDADINRQRLDQANTQFEQRLHQDKTQFDQKLGQQIVQFNKTLSRQISVDTFEQKLAYQQYLIRDLDSIIREAGGKTGNQSSAYKLYNDEKLYNAAMNAWTDHYNSFIITQLNDPSRKSRAAAESNNVTAGVGGNKGGNESSYQGGSFASSLGINVHAGAGKSQFESGSADYSIRDKQKVIQWLNSNPVPIYRPSKSF